MLYYYLGSDTDGTRNEEHRVMGSGLKTDYIPVEMYTIFTPKADLTSVLGIRRISYIVNLLLGCFCLS